MWPGKVEIAKCNALLKTYACTVRGLAKKKKKKKSEITTEVGGWVQVSLGFFWENRPKTALNQY